MWVDPTYVKVRKSRRLITVAAIIAVSVNSDGRREVPGLAVGPSEAETFWTGVLRSLTRRALRGAKLVVSDAHVGLKAAITNVQKATWQRCRLHLTRNVLAHATKDQRQREATLVGTRFAQSTSEAAHTQWSLVTEQLVSRFPKLDKLMEEAEHDVLAYFEFPREHRTKLQGTNTLEWLNGELKRRSDVVGLFPSERAIVRLEDTLLLEQFDERPIQRRYVKQETRASMDESAPIRLSAIVH